MKKLLPNLVLFLVLFFNNVYSQTGSSCDNAINIGSLPFQQEDNTINFQNPLLTSQGTLCGAVPSTVNYRAGNDAFYKYVADEYGSITITMTPNAGSTNSGVFVYSGCTNLNVNCIGGLANADTSVRKFTIDVIQGQTYIIVVSSSATTPTVGYNLLVQKERCSPNPSNGYAVSVTQTSAQLTWTNQQPFNKWQVVVQNPGEFVPSGSGEVTTSMPFIKNGLLPATAYQFWVRAECSPNSNSYTPWSGPYLFSTAVCPAENMCSYTFRLTDTAFNGWGENRFQVKQNGIVVATLGTQIQSGAGPIDVPVSLCTNTSFELSYSATGAFPGQCGIQILNSFGQLLYTKQDDNPSLNSVLYSNSVNCTTPACNIVPTNVSVTDTTFTTAYVSWTAPATTSWDIYVSSTDEAPNESTIPTYDNITSNGFTVTNLIQDTFYSVYIRVNCSPSPSAWSQAYYFSTAVSCFAPYGITVSGVNTTAATVMWTTSTPSSAWEVLITQGDGNITPSEDPTIGNGTFLFPVSNQPNFTIPEGTLSPATIYRVFVRTVCSPSNKSKWTPVSGGYTFNTVTCSDSQKCTYKFVLTNTNGNTWNGGRMQVKQNGILIATLGATIVNNSNGIAVALCNNVPFELYWSVAGTAPDNLGISILNPYGDEVYKKLPGSGSPLTSLFNATTVCTPPTCAKPENLLASETTSNSTLLSWTSNSSGLYDLYIVPVGGPAPQNYPLTAPTISGVSNPYTLTQFNGQPLQPSASYTYYVRKICSDTDKSTWTINTPYTFSTTPTNDECINAQTIPVNLTQTCTNTIIGTTAGATASNPILTPPLIGTGCGPAFKDVWYKFTAANTSQTITLTPEIATSFLNVSIFSGSCDTLIKIACSTSNITTLQNLEIDQTYYIRVYTASLSTAPTVFTICITSPPINDDCAFATNLPVNLTLEPTQYLNSSTLGASASNPTITGTVCVGTDDDQWFKFTATAATHVLDTQIIDSSTSTILGHALYTGNCNSLTTVYCSTNLQSVATNLTPGVEYKIRVYTQGTVANKWATFKIFVTTPPVISNDECSSAATIVVGLQNNPVLTSGYLTGATASPQTSTCSGMEDDDVWYKFTSTGTQTLINLTSTKSTIALNYSVYSAADCNSLVLVSCHNVGQSVLNLTPSQNYFIRIWSNGAAAVHVGYTLSVTKVAEPLIVENTLTAQQLVSTVLINTPCVTISNVTSSTGTNFGSVNGIGYFSAPQNSLFPIDAGIVLSTGNINNIPGPNTSVSSTGVDAWLGDSDLNTIIEAATGNTMQSKNASKLEFDFVTLNASMSFNFLFASEEYGQFQCNFSDAFAFLLTDLTTNITTNLAVVPNTTIPISTVTIRDNANNGDCTSQNAAFFGGYFGSESNTQYNTAANFNGITKLMTASSAVVPGNLYHIKLVVADRQDSQYDSAVFIQAGSFTSGPPECSDKIKLVAFVDENTNGIKDNDERIFTYGSFTYQLNDAPEVNNISSPIGNYTIYDFNPTNFYDFSYVINSESQPYFSVAPTNFSNINIPLGSGTNTLYFPIHLIQGYNDVTVSIVPVSPPVAGMSFKNRIMYTNRGVISTSGSITFTKDPASTITNISQSGTLGMPGGFTYNFTNLAPFESRYIDVTMSIPPIPTVNIDDVLSNNVVISAPANDININNNTFVNTQIVVASYDPNDKMEAHGEKIQFSNFHQDDYLTYTIRFQNTGTSNAINIRLEDLLDAQFDESSIRMIDASHSYVMNRIGNKVVWYFDYIQLPGMIVNEPLSHGYVTFRIKLKPGFAIGDIIPNHADIYFDTNPPITTNTFNIEFVTQLGTSTFEASNIVVYPNPGNGNIQISMSQTSETIRSVALYDILGKCVKRTKVGSSNSSINVSDLSAGIYMMEIVTENNLKAVKKLVVN